ncbi:PEPxxWA-CTERM sorting domain-containing protein [Sphingomonas sp. TREG-RG-20F-R18-01]|uniref:PEPxxWA-CTERM sorting domain-containing protein n=1 Tax=Sphingomonas sp. TREG-RG-20F-R18-01 TaxID=2914982 RepID=UPI001F568FA9|nr:PEPxxWA-CTERM sorting domain-containing protein [Sphingomonas sp. TREG-RG-20F-R18-01]
MRKISMAACACMVVCCTPANAATIVQMASGGQAYVNQFDPTFGTLNSVSFSARYFKTVYFDYPYQLGAPIVTASGSISTNSFTAYDLTGSYQSFTENPQLIGVHFGGEASGTTSSNLDEYIGNRLVTLVGLVNAKFAINGAAVSAVSTSFPSLSSDTYTVTYDYTPGAVPEPATWALMLAGFGAIGFAMCQRGARIRVGGGLIRAA